MGYFITHRTFLATLVILSTMACDTQHQKSDESTDKQADSIDYRLLDDTAHLATVLTIDADTQYIYLRKILFTNNTNHEVWLPSFSIPTYVNFIVLDTSKTELTIVGDKIAYYKKSQDSIHHGWSISVCHWRHTDNWKKIDPHSETELYTLAYDTKQNHEMDSLIYRVNCFLDTLNEPLGYLDKLFALSQSSIVEIPKHKSEFMRNSE
jgi:hypothetical protein